jgi:hypothetical protein
MKKTTLQAELEPVARSYRRFRIWRGLAQCWAVAAGVGAILIVLQSTGWNLGWALPLYFGFTAVALIWVWQRNLQAPLDYRWIAKKIEVDHPKLHTLLVTAAEQEPGEETGQLNYLQERLIAEARQYNLRNPWNQRPSERLFFAQCAGWGALLAFLIILPGLLFSGRGTPATAPGAEIRGVTVTPGDTEIERGSGLVIVARFEEPAPVEARLVVLNSNGETLRLPLARNLEDPVFGASLPEVAGDLIYRVEFGDKQTRDYKVAVYEHPALRRADAELHYPEYTGLAPRKIEDTRRISAVEGTQLDYEFQLNKAVVSARLMPREGAAIDLLPMEEGSSRYQTRFQLEESGRYRLQLQDAQGRTNKIPAEFILEVSANKAPELKLVMPRGDTRVSALEEVTFQGEVVDDFGIESYGLAYTLIGQETEFVELGRNGARNEKRAFEHLLRMEELGVDPDQLISYFIWADDKGPDGELRRSFSDMYFAEVRPFDEIFRENQMGGGERQQGGGGGTGASEELAELQKQVITATWNLERKSGRRMPEGYSRDVQTIREGQDQALEMARQLGGRIQDPQLIPIVELIEKQMGEASGLLKEAERKAGGLTPALAAEQAAYQSILRLQAREYEVSQGNNQGGGGGGGSRSQRQLDQLEFKQEENRYQTERQASLQNPAQREQLQVLNRLRELAQRQQTINERLQELQTMLLEAKTEEEKEALRRQLKRLQEEERQMLADVDELQQRMAGAENSSQMAEAREQLEQTRSEIQRTAEELERGAVSQALASGTRAQRELQEMRDEFRRRTANEFSEQMREMRADARELAGNQEELGRKIEELPEARQRSLSDGGVREQLAEQQRRLAELLTNMRRVTEQAEASEPLLSKHLYDTLRKTDQANIDNQLARTSELLRLGLAPQAGVLEEQARRNITELKQGVELAAESVLGDEHEALRLARRELDDLSRELDREIAQASARNRGANGEEREGSAGEPGAGREGAERSTASGEEGAELAARGGGQRSPGNEEQEGSSPGERGEGGGQNGDANSESDLPGQGSGELASGSGNGSPTGGEQAQAGESGSQGGGGQGQGTAQSDASRPLSPSPPGGSGEPGGSQERTARSLGGNPYGGGAGGERNAGGLRGGGWMEERAGGAEGFRGPITGNEFTEWSDRLRNLEEMIEDPEMRSELARIRDRARHARAEFKRHSEEPKWDLVEAQIAAPLAQVRDWVRQELARRDSPENLAPIDRDPVPRRYSDLVRRYYERLSENSVVE